VLVAVEPARIPLRSGTPPAANGPITLVRHRVPRAEADDPCRNYVRRRSFAPFSSRIGSTPEEGVRCPISRYRIPPMPFIPMRWPAERPLGSRLLKRGARRCASSTSRGQQAVDALLYCG